MSKIILFILAPIFLISGFIMSAPAAQAAEHVNYLAVGDSITYGVGTSDGRSYADRVGVRRVAVGGTCWSDSCGALSFRQAVLPKIEALPKKPETLIFHYGINDLVLGVPYDELIHRVINIRAQLRAEGYKVVLGTIIPSPADSVFSTTISGNGQSVQWNRLRFNEWVRTQADYVNYAKALQCGGYQCPGLSTLGDCHVNDRGAQLMADVLRQWLKDQPMIARS